MGVFTLCCFPTFSSQIESEYKPTAVKDVLFEAIKTNPSYIVRNQSTKQCPIVFTLRKDSMLYFNSFLPVIRIDFYDRDFGTKIVVKFRLKTSVSIILHIFTAVAFIFELALIDMFFKKELVSPLLLGLPVSLAVLAITMSYLGLKLGSKPVKNFLISTLSE